MPVSTTQITIKLVPKEYDLLREVVRSAHGLALEASRVKGQDVKSLRERQGRAARLADLLDRL